MAVEPAPEGRAETHEKRRISILGATGSIGTNTLAVSPSIRRTSRSRPSPPSAMPRASPGSRRRSARRSRVIADRTSYNVLKDALDGHRHRGRRRPRRRRGGGRPARRRRCRRRSSAPPACRRRCRHPRRLARSRSPTRNAWSAPATFSWPRRGAPMSRSCPSIQSTTRSSRRSAAEPHRGRRPHHPDGLGRPVPRLDAGKP